MVLTTSNLNEVKYFHNKYKNKSILIEKTLKLAKSRKQWKNRTEVCNLTKTSKSEISCRKC